MKVSLFLDHLIQIRYTGTESISTLAVDADGGVGGGLVTLVTGTTSTTFNLGGVGYDTAAELVAGIQALAGWDARLNGRGGSVYTVFEDTSTATDGKFADVTAINVGHHYEDAIPFANSDRREVVAGSATDAVPVRSCPVVVCAGGTSIVTVEVGVTSTGSAGDVTVYLGKSTPAGIVGDVYTPLSLTDFDSAAQDALVVAASGTDNVRVSETFDIEIGSSKALAVVAITNAAAGAVEVDVSVL